MYFSRHMAPTVELVGFRLLVLRSRKCGFLLSAGKATESGRSLLHVDRGPQLPFEIGEHGSVFPTQTCRLVIISVYSQSRRDLDSVIVGRSLQRWSLPGGLIGLFVHQSFAIMSSCSCSHLDFEMQKNTRQRRRSHMIDV